MSFNSNNLQRLGNQVNVSMNSDEDGYFGRECPVEECLGYFKITFGTGLKGPAPCHCPYCGHTGDSNTFWTKEQLDYARSVVLRQVTDALHKDMKSMEFDHKPRGGFGFGISLKVTQGRRIPIQHYKEKELETHVVCDNCTLRYAIYGVFGWCPDCGIHNSVQILTKNLELAKKELVLAETAEAELAAYLIGDALENVVSAFDGFGRVISAERARKYVFKISPARGGMSRMPLASISRRASRRKSGNSSAALFKSDTFCLTKWASSTRITYRRQMIPVPLWGARFALPMRKSRRPLESSKLSANGSLREFCPQLPNRLVP